ncbi:MAG TPA: DEAD/DEAH box helicase [Chthoniobacteraceae bacterium]|jgi:superfamily II DNA or RNA helicase|nr:DEAD/DEAH box helicase [Chthoniobacteraceae bacterium]
MPDVVEITERLLSDAGGWQALKEGRGLLEAGKVQGAGYEPPFLRGVVKDGIKEYRSGLRIVTKTNIENLCTCRISRERAMVCAHSLAVGLAYLKGPEKGLEPIKSIEETAAPPTPEFSLDDGVEAVLYMVIAPSFTSGVEKNSVMMGVEFQTGGRRVLAHTLNIQSRYRVTAEDLRAIEAIRAVNHSELPGMMTLNRSQCRTVLEALRGHPRVTLGRDKPANVAELLAAIPEAKTAGEERSAPVRAAGKPEFVLQLEGSLNFLAAKLQVRQGRDPAAENAARDRLLAARFSPPNGKGEMVLRGERDILRFLGGTLPVLQREWKVEFGERLTNINETIAHIRPKVEARGSGENWFELTVSLASPDGQTFSSAEIQRLLQMGQNHVRLKNGGLALFDSGMLDELGQALGDTNANQPQPGTYRIHKAQAGYLAGVLGDEIVGEPAWKKWTREQMQPDSISPVSLGALDSVLRPYQKLGVYWMQFLARNGFGGILADEMGLGKTLQALAFLAGMRDGVSLIVCPSSLVQNWAREAAKFTPELRVLAIEGPDRHSRLGRLAEADLAITSYPLLRRDAGRYEGIEFRAVILDEAQHIKNPETQNAQAATGLRARHRMVLTGTPLENSVRDLWSIMNFAMPGYLGSREDFKERYEQPIAQGENGVKTRLGKRVRPFLLRRMKREVYKELPEKLEQVLYCTLNAKQAEVYEKLLAESRRQVTELASEKNQGKARMLMLTALLRLRQACCDLRLLGIQDVAQEEASAKMELLDELLREAIDGGHRVLIFSQFVTMLQIQKTALETAGISYCYLDGRTKDRMREVDRFQNGMDIPVFLISLKAGGVGLNLTAADTVVHFDPWWNPAVEAQATDRAHRIGQEKVVTAYKLIARNTVEEKILKLQESKKGLLDAIESEEPVMAGLSTAEIQALIA